MEGGHRPPSGSDRLALLGVLGAGRMRAGGLLVGSFRVAVRLRAVLMALGVVALAMMLGRGAMALRRRFVGFGGLVVVLNCHGLISLVVVPGRRRGRARKERLAGGGSCKPMAL